MASAARQARAELRPDGRQGGRGDAPLLRPIGRGSLAILVGLTFASYVFVCAFWLYLSTGDWVRWRPEAFIADFTNPVTLPDLFERTLNVLTHPWMILVGGLVLAAVIAVPILVAVLHRLWVAVALAAVTALASHAPAMALALAFGCVLAAKTRLRRPAPFLAAVVAALPLVLYLYLFSSAGSSSAAIMPTQRWALKAPYVAAVVAAVAAFGLLMGLARFSRYRPGLVWPLLAVLPVISVPFFVTQIGRAELEYQLIARRLAPGDAVFEAVDTKTWVAAHHEQGLSGEAIARRASAVLEERRAALQADCRRFLARYSASTRAPSVAWVLAQCQGLQLDRPGLDQGWVRSTAAHLAPVPGEESAGPAKRIESQREALEAAATAWQSVRENYPGTPQAALASWRLAELDLRRLTLPNLDDEEANALVARAQERLWQAQRAMTAVVGESRQQRQTPRKESSFSPSPSEPPHEYYEEALYRVRRLLWLMERNAVTTNRRSAEALGELLQINPYGMGPAAYAQRLYELAGRYEDTPMSMNLKLAVALAEGDMRRRADQLCILATQRRDEDAAIEASFEMGQLLLQYPPLSTRAEGKSAADFFGFVLRESDDPRWANPWKELAAERLAILNAASQRGH